MTDSIIIEGERYDVEPFGVAGDVPCWRLWKEPYVVTLSPPTCTCRASRGKSLKPCKHIRELRKLQGGDE